jgi:hypothetical protein
MSQVNSFSDCSKSSIAAFCDHHQQNNREDVSIENKYLDQEPKQNWILVKVLKISSCKHVSVASYILQRFNLLEIILSLGHIALYTYHCDKKHYSFNAI